MYQGAGDPRSAQRSLDSPAGFSPEATARIVLARVRKLLDAFVLGMPVESTSSESLAATLSDPELERERLFLLGWLHWLNDDPAAAESLLAEAMRRAREPNAIETLAESAYWCARVRLLLGRAEALAEFEGVLRMLGGSPRATVWFVDLLGRAGRVDRAEQVWKSVRGNRRVADCPEAPLLEARSLLRRGETTPAERLLHEAAPAAGVVWVERLLLLAWIAASQKQFDQARGLLRQAEKGPYPSTALQAWTARIEQRAGVELSAEEAARYRPPSLREFLSGQQARLDGQLEGAMAAYRAALGHPVAQPFARYALACLGEEDFAALLASQPGLFLAVRCRARLMGERFRRREVSPAEYLDALQNAAVTGYQDAAAEHFRRLATALQQRQPDPTSLRELAAHPATDAVARNAFRAAFELTVRRLPATSARELLLEWSQREDVDDELRGLVGRQLLRLLLLTESDEEVRAAAERLLPPDEPLLVLASGRRQPPVENQQGADAPRSPAVRLWQAAQAIAQQIPGPERWRDEVSQLRSHARWKGLAQSLLLQDAGQRGDVAAVWALLDEADVWRGLRAPPSFVLRTLESILVAQPAHPGWRNGLSRWLSLWDLAALGPAGARLATHAGRTTVRGDTVEPPPSVPAVPWLLHQAARALGRDDAVEALVFTRRALALDPELATVPVARVVREAVPELEHRARAQRLAAVASAADEKDSSPSSTFAGAVEALAELPEGAAVLDALTNGDLDAARVRLDALSERPHLPPRLAHHLALLMQRGAAGLEEREETDRAEPYWRRAWLCWLRFLTTAEADARRIVLDGLLRQHRHRVNDLLARNAVDAARRHWDLVRESPVQAGPIEDGLGHDLAERVERFREELATEYLLTTREAMRFGVIPEGCRADYEKGLGYLRRLLSLDRDNVRLLAALVEICNDWFLDLYHLGDAAALRRRLSASRRSPCSWRDASTITPASCRPARPCRISGSFAASSAPTASTRSLCTARRYASTRPTTTSATCWPNEVLSSEF